MIGIILAAGLAVGAVSLAASNVMISVKRYKIPADRSLKILHLSDLHKKSFGKNYSRLLKKIPNESFDFVCFTGDLISRSEKIEDILAKKIPFMKCLLEICPVYYISGNHEADVPEKYARLKDELEKIGVCVLENNSASFGKDGIITEIAGLSCESKFYKNEKGGYSNLEKISAEYLNEKLLPKSEGFTVLLAHSPFGFEEYESWGAELVLCGHVHGGIVRLPLVGGVLSPERKFFPEYDGGIYTKNKTSMVVSRGLGKLRLFNCPEISVVELVKKQEVQR